MSQSRIRNFCIVAHIDHGKSTLADRLIEATGDGGEAGDAGAGARHHGPRARARHHHQAERRADDATPRGTASDYELNLIDTPGHVDFTYEVSRSLAACEGAILVVDASQGIQAQTLSNLFLAMDAGLEIIPVLNKIDLPGAEPERRAQEIMDLIGAEPDEILRGLAPRRASAFPSCSRRSWRGCPPPRGDEDAPLRALIFDSYYDRYRGAIPSVRVVDGVVARGHGDRLRRASGRRLRRGRGRLPPAAASVPTDELGPGEVGYVVASLRDVRDARVGDTILDAAQPRRRAAARLPGRASRWCSPASTRPTPTSTRTCATRWRSCSSTTPSLHYEPETSTALGFGFRCGFLGLLHMEIVQERLEREFDLDLVTTVPSVEYHVYRTDGDDAAAREPDATCPIRPSIDRIEEPYVKARIMAPADYIGGDHEAGHRSGAASTRT